ncbi:Thiosulfate sulfurtransferase [Labeo rohita]|uniref:Thiosulfate sulfurtransferase n=1 Tax=Labeo rohita TaxID=84645 RepID=A0ABQ8LD51_LABRO|nr:Thiosulfate sulfurtransferase [Labeo rohita]
MAAQTRALVAVRWLADAVKSNRVGPSLWILDASWHVPKLKHNPRADVPEPRSSTSTTVLTKAPRLITCCLARASLQTYMGNLGIGNNTHVVVYDTSDFGSFSAPWVYWMFRVFGHNSVSEGHPVTKQYSKPERADFKASFDKFWVKTYEDILNNIKTKEFQLVNTRVNGRFHGVEPEPRESEYELLVVLLRNFSVLIPALLTKKIKKKIKNNRTHHIKSNGFQYKYHNKPSSFKPLKPLKKGFL